MQWSRLLQVVDRSSPSSLYSVPHESNTRSPILHIRSILTLPFHICLRLPSGLCLSAFPFKILYGFHFSPMHATCPVHAFLKFQHCQGRAILQAYTVDAHGILKVLHRSSGNWCSLYYLHSFGISGEIWDLTQYSLNSRLMRLPLGHQGGKRLFWLYMLYISDVYELVLIQDLRTLRVDSVGWRRVLVFPECFPLQFHRDRGVKLQLPPIP
jgi:hypothetical protein